MSVWHQIIKATSDDKVLSNLYRIESLEGINTFVTAFYLNGMISSIFQS